MNVENAVVPTPEQIKEIEKHNEFDQLNINEQYDKVAAEYEKVYTTVGWPDPEITARKAIDFGYIPGLNLLDMGCGTGMVGKNL